MTERQIYEVERELNYQRRYLDRLIDKMDEAEESQDSERLQRLNDRYDRENAKLEGMRHILHDIGWYIVYGNDENWRIQKCRWNTES